MDYTILGKEVPVSKIDKELKGLWEQDQASTKASLINLALYSENPDSLVENAKTSLEITREHACRALLITLDRKDKKPHIRSWITAHCNLTGGKNAICCEQVSFFIEGYSPGIVRNTLFAHLDSDLPLVVWWQGELSLSYREGFYSQIDRLIFDSACWEKPLEQIKKIEHSLADKPSLIVQDLAWTRTFCMRVALAAVASHPAVLSRISQMKKLQITISENAKTSGLLLLAWLTHLTGYQYQKTNPATEKKEIFYTFTHPDSAPLTVCLQLKKESAAKSKGVLALQLFLDNCSVSITREGDLLRQQIKLEKEMLLDQHCVADATSDVALTSQQLSRGGKNSLYKRILPHFITLL